MPRFSKGTTDHDGDGRMGGSLKGDGEMVKKAKPNAQSGMEGKETPAKVPDKAAKAKVDEQFAEADAKGEPEHPAEDAIVGQQVRGY